MQCNVEHCVTYEGMLLTWLHDEELRSGHEVPELQPRDLAAERVLQTLAQGLHHGEAAVRAAQQQLGDAVHRGEDVDRLDWLRHGVLRREQVEVEHRAVTPHDEGLGRQEGDALELEERVVEGVGEEVPGPLGHHDGDHDQQQLVDVVGDLHHYHS